MEEWRPVTGWENLYQVSDQGRVRSLPRISQCSNGTRRRYPGKLLTPTSDGHYYGVLLHDIPRRKRVPVHTLVAQAFLGPCPEGQEVRHGPGGKLDNRLVNLSYGTRRQNNTEDKLRDGTLLRGESHPEAKLTEEDVRAIRILYAAGVTYMKLAEQFGVSWTNIREIVHRRAWKHVP